MNRALPFVALTVTGLLACAHARTPEHAAMMQRADCEELLKAADAARAVRDPDLAAELAGACPQEKLDALISKSPPEAALLWCGRARAAGSTPACAPKTIGELTAALHPRITLGPPEEGIAPDPLLASALDELGKELNLAWDAQDPDVIVGRLSATVEHLTTTTTTLVPDAKGAKVRVPATQHRFIARVEAQVELGSQTRVLRAADETRDTTWDAPPRLSIAAKFAPAVASEPELKKRAALAFLRTLGKALAASPPEAVDVSDAKGCVAYGLSLNLAAGDSTAAARGLGDPAKVAACETLLGEPVSAGIPVP